MKNIEISILMNIYPQVHLVSEHVWCDDYLVRSLYLKNTQTGETRTVTQFHFLAWPNRALPESTKSLLEFRRQDHHACSCSLLLFCENLCFIILNILSLIKLCMAYLKNLIYLSLLSSIPIKYAKKSLWSYLNYFIIIFKKK